MRWGSRSPEARHRSWCPSTELDSGLAAGSGDSNRACGSARHVGRHWLAFVSLGLTRATGAVILLPMQIDPLVEWQRLTETYSKMYDDELLQLAVDSDDLTEQAKQVLSDEMRKRGLELPRAASP